MFQSFPFLSQQLWHLQLQLCHNHTSLLVNKYYDWSVISLSVCVLLSQSSLPSLLSITFFPVCGHSTFPSFPIYVFLGCPSEFVQPRAYDGNPSAPSYCICLFFFSAHFAEWRQILFFNECQWVQFNESRTASSHSRTADNWLIPPLCPTYILLCILLGLSTEISSKAVIVRNCQPEIISASPYSNLSYGTSVSCLHRFPVLGAFLDDMSNIWRLYGIWKLYSWICEV